MPRSAPPGAGYILEIPLSALSRAAGYDFAIRIRDEFGAQSAHGARRGSASVLGEGGGNPPHPEGWGCGLGAATPEEATAG